VHRAAANGYQVDFHTRNEVRFRLHSTPTETNNEHCEVNSTDGHNLALPNASSLYLYIVNTPLGKLSAGLLTMLPLVLFVLFIIAMFGGLYNPDPLTVSGNEPNLVLLNLGYAMLLLVLFAITSLAMTVYYLVHIVNNQRLDGGQRLFWALFTLLMGPLGCLLYWIFQIWREDDDRVEHNYTS
jgi:hypothetical protein